MRPKRNARCLPERHAPRIDDNGSLLTGSSENCWSDHIHGLTMKAPYSGVLRYGRMVAAVRVESREQISISRRVSPPRSQPVAWLEVAESFHGNVRVVRNQRAFGLAADTMLDGHAHLPATFSAIQASFAIGTAMLQETRMSAVRAHVKLPDIDRNTVDLALEQLEPDEPGLVRQDDAWELRVHMGGEVVPIRLKLRARELVLSHVILRNVPCDSTECMQAIADHAFRVNDRLRGSRVQLSAGDLIVETRLHGGQLDHGWLSHAARSVAVAAGAARDCIQILATQPDVARQYCETFALTM